MTYEKTALLFEISDYLNAFLKFGHLVSHLFKIKIDSWVIGDISSSKVDFISI